jgi:hypothetical protein
MVEIIIPVATGVFLLLLWLGAHLYWNAKRRQQFGKAVNVSQTSLKDNKDIETGSIKTAPTLSPTNSGPDPDMDTSELDTTDLERDGIIKMSPPKNTPPSQHPQQPTHRTEKTNPVSVDLEQPQEAQTETHTSNPVSGDRQQPQQALQRTGKSNPVSVDSPDRSAAGLPPRPPTRRSNSMKLKRLRKRKKKKSKKVVPLRRVNSREGINEMPIISESEDEESECDSECTSDDGSSYDTSSGCLTPAHSLSRASSPQLSPKDELYIPDGFDENIQFYIEAPDFPNLLGGGNDDMDQDDSKKNDKTTMSDLTGLPNRKGPRMELTPRNMNPETTKQDLRTLESDPRKEQEDGDFDDDGSPRKLKLPWLN